MSSRQGLDARLNGVDADIDLMQHALESFWLFINAVVVFWMQVWPSLWHTVQDSAPPTNARSDDA